MTVPYERSNAIVWTRRFLRSLLDPKQTPRVPRDIRRQAASLLKHYPSDYEMGRVIEKVPEVFGTYQDFLGKKKG